MGSARRSIRFWLRSRRAAVPLLTFALFASACGGGGLQQPTGAEDAGRQLFHPDGWEGIPEDARPGDELYDPTEAGEDLPAGYRERVGRDKIRPIYVPNFVRPEEVSWPEEELVIGVYLEGEARAYPVEFLSHRDVVVDMHRGIPTFVTW